MKPKEHEPIELPTSERTSVSDLHITSSSRSERRSTSSNSSKMFSIDSILKKPDVSSPSKSDHEKCSSDGSVISDGKPDERTLNSPIRPEISRINSLPSFSNSLHSATTLPNPSAPLMYSNPLFLETMAVRQRLLQTQILQRNLLSSNIENFRLFNDMYSNNPALRSQMNAEN
jgi:hypothetical protein